VARLASLPVVLAAVGLAVAACLGPRALDATGQAARGFSLPGLASSRDRIALSEYAGKPVIISFFASWSPPCAAEIHLLSRFYRFYHGQVHIIGVDARDDRIAALNLVRSSLVTYPVAIDPALVVAAKYNVPGIPSTYFLNTRHQIVLADYGWLSWKKLRAGVAAMDPGSPAADRSG
jgi:thiol-disulfide isomerase/thioredoxin